MISIFFLIHGPYEPLRPVTTLLHSSLSAVSRATSGKDDHTTSRYHPPTHLFGGLPLKKLPLLYNVHDREISLHFVPDAIVGNLVFPAYFQYPSVTAHLKCQNSDQTAYSFISFSSTFAFILIELTVRKPVHAKLGKTC